MLSRVHCNFASQFIQKRWSHLIYQGVLRNVSLHIRLLKFWMHWHREAFIICNLRQWSKLHLCSCVVYCSIHVDCGWGSNLFTDQATHQSTALIHPQRMAVGLFVIPNQHTAPITNLTVCLLSTIITTLLCQSVVPVVFFSGHIVRETLHPI